jgi:hypothetical protein
MASIIGPHRVDTSAGPLDVYVTSDATAHVLTPSNWGTYPELRTTLNGRAAYGISVYFERSGEEWSVRPYSQANGFGAYVSRHENRASTEAQIRAAIKVASAALAQLLTARPGILAMAMAHRTEERRTRLSGELQDARARVAALAAQLDELTPPVDVHATPADVERLTRREGPGESLAHAAASLVAYVDACDETTGGPGAMDTGDVLDYVERFRVALAAPGPDVTLADPDRVELLRMAARLLETATGDRATCYVLADVVARGTRALVLRDQRTHDAAASPSDVVIALTRNGALRAI